jgi:hypothetical protein
MKRSFLFSMLPWLRRHTNQGISSQNPAQARGHSLTSLLVLSRRAADSRSISPLRSRILDRGTDNVFEVCIKQYTFYGFSAGILNK